METYSTIKANVALFVGVLFTIIIFALGETDLFPLIDTSQAGIRYTLQLFYISATVLGCYIALKFFYFKTTSNLCNTQNKLGRYYFYCFIRQGILGLALILNTSAYYLLGCESSAAYCVIIVLLTAMFCTASQKEFLHLTDSKQQTK